MKMSTRLSIEGVEEDEVVKFYRPRDENGIFSNFYRQHLVMLHPYSHEKFWPYNTVLYATPEHRYQAMKASNCKDHDFVNEAVNPAVAKDRGGRYGIALRDGWGNSYGDLCYYVMLEVVTARVEQSLDFHKALLRTGEKLIVEDSPTDDIWGWRHRESYDGKNLLGVCLMEVRERIRT